jgi:hypothetical protein
MERRFLGIHEKEHERLSLGFVDKCASIKSRPRARLHFRGFVGDFDEGCILKLLRLYEPPATAFRQLKRTVVNPTRIVRAWTRQPNFLN